MPSSCPFKAKLPPGTLSHRNRVLVSLLPWRLVTFDDLPRHASPFHQLAIAKHFAGKDWTVAEARESIGGKARIGIVSIPMLVLCTQVMNDPDRRFAFAHFGEYHQYYRKRERKRCQVIMRSDEIWPIILRGNRNKSDEKETIWDGWHRFHAYYAKGHQQIAAIWYADEEP